MIREIRYWPLSFSILIAALFISTPIAQAADPIPRPPTEAELRLLEGIPRDLRPISGYQIDILRLGNELRGNTDEMARRLGLTGDPITARQKAAELYENSFRALEFVRAMQVAPRSGTITAPPIFTDSAARIAEYYKNFGGPPILMDDTLRREEALLRLIYNPTTKDFFTPIQRQVAELMITSRDPQTFARPNPEALAEIANARYKTNFTENSFSGNWRLFLGQAFSIPLIKAEQDRIKAAIDADTSLSPAEKEFAKAVLATLKDGKAPTIADMAQLHEISRRNAVNIINAFTPDREAAMIATIKANPAFFSAQSRNAANAGVIPPKTLLKATEQWRVAQQALVPDPAAYIQSINARMQPPSMPTIFILPPTAVPTLPLPTPPTPPAIGR